MAVSQIMAIAYYEFRMHWRRRGNIVITLAMLAIFILPMLLTRGELTSRAALGDEGIIRYTQSITLFHWGTVAVVLFAIAPFLFADAIPRDRQLGVSELFNTTPLPIYAYLIGKILAAWLSVLSCIFLTGLVSGAIWWIFVAPFNLAIFLPIWFVGGLSMALINMGIIVPLTAGVSSSRVAVLICIGYVVVLSLLLGFRGREDILDALNPLRPGIFYTYLQLSNLAISRHLSLEWTIVLGLLQVVGLTIGMCFFLRWRSQH
jgi:hypothetical protein